MVLGADVSPRLGVFEPARTQIECIYDAGCAFACRRCICVREHLKKNSATLPCGFPLSQDSLECGLGNQFFCSFGQYQSVDHFEVKNKLLCRAQDIKSCVVLYFVLIILVFFRL